MSATEPEKSQEVRLGVDAILRGRQVEPRSQSVLRNCLTQFAQTFVHSFVTKRLASQLRVASTDSKKVKGKSKAKIVVFQDIIQEEEELSRRAHDNYLETNSKC